MGDQELARLAELIKTDPVFRAHFNENPQAAAASQGIELSQEEYIAFRDEHGEGLGIAAEWPPD